VRIRWWWFALGTSVLAGLAYLAFGVFAVHLLWVDDEVDEAAPVFDSQAEPAPSTTVPAEATAEDVATPPPPTIEALAAGSFVSLDHGTSGDATVLGDGSPQRFLRLTGFATDNGPDVNVYLSTTPPDGEESTFDDEFVDLGDLRGNVGDQNYEIPSGVDLERFHTVVIWCVRFDSAFGAARLA
jgi:hypothetical protein